MLTYWHTLVLFGYIYIYIYICVCVCVCVNYIYLIYIIYIYIYIYICIIYNTCISINLLLESFPWEKANITFDVSLIQKAVVMQLMKSHISARETVVVKIFTTNFESTTLLLYNIKSIYNEIFGISCRLFRIKTTIIFNIKSFLDLLGLLIQPKNNTLVLIIWFFPLL